MRAVAKAAQSAAAQCRKSASEAVLSPTARCGDAAAWNLSCDGPGPAAAGAALHKWGPGWFGLGRRGRGSPGLTVHRRASRPACRRPARSAASRLCRSATAAAGESAAISSSSLYTLAQLEVASKQSIAKLQELQHSIQADLHDLQHRIPLLVRSIWGKHSESVVAALRQRQAVAQRLIQRWEEAEHRLVAVANSLTTQQTGQKLVGVGVPLAAAQLWPRPAYAYHAPAPQHPQQPSLALELTLGQLREAVARLAAGLLEEAAIAVRGLFLFCLFLPAVLTAPICLLTDLHRDRWLELVRWTLEQAGACVPMCAGI